MQPNDVGRRTVGSTLTPEILEALWPVAHERLVQRLRACGIDGATAEDAVAEAATRALSRGLHVIDLDDFCRWAFVVARNVAYDTGRRSRHFLPLEAVVEQPDRYDLANHVEMRHEWHATARAMTTLSPADQAALLATLETERPLGRREAVRDAVRRHRARLRLRQAMGQAGALVGWLRRPRDVSRFWPAQWLAQQDRAALLLAALVLAPATAPSVGPAVSPEPAAALAPALPVDAPRVTPAGDMRDARPAPPPTAVSTPTTHGLAAAPADQDVDTAGYAFDFTPSPAYEHDTTVFAAGSSRDCDDAASCPVLFKSTDGGASWERLRAEGRDYGNILLPPAYPQDPRIFSTGLLLSVSDDGGQTFRTLGPATGPASMSPLFSSTDPRIVFGSDRALRSATPMEYRDGGIGFVPLATRLPVGTLATDFWFGPDYARDGRMLVAGIDPPDVAGLDSEPTLRGERSVLYDCTQTACTRVADFGTSPVPPSVAWSMHRPNVVVAGSVRSFQRSLDGGRTFEPLPIPGSRPGRMLHRLTATPDGKLYASVSLDGPAGNRLFVSADDGATWQLKQEASGAFFYLAPLPDGVLLDGRQVGGKGIACSVDGGLTWASRCRR